MSNTLFQAPSSFFDPSFWEELYKRKLHVYKLESSAQLLTSGLNCSNGKNNESFEFSSGSFESGELPPENSVKDPIRGTLENVNTVEEFRDADKKCLLDKVAQNVLDAIFSGEAVRNPSLLTQFVLLTFADLKSYKFTYWLGVPALLPEKPFVSTNTSSLKEHSQSLLHVIYTAIAQYFRVESASLQSVFAVYHIPKEGVEDSDSAFVSPLPFTDGQLLTLYEAFRHVFHPHIYILIPDSAASNNSFGWSVRNFLTLLSMYRKMTHHDSVGTVRIIGLRGVLARKLTSGTTQQVIDSGLPIQLETMSYEEIAANDHSVYSEIQIDPDAFAAVLDQHEHSTDESHPMGHHTVLKTSTATDSGGDAGVGGDDGVKKSVSGLACKVVGWESNERGKPGPRVADLSNSLDGRYLMAQAVDLNLSLMKWRMWPELDTAKLAQTKCLLLGSGTLGCAVARSLLGWGVRNITLVDNGRVSYSNPARQCLFEYQDCVDKAFKSEAAAARLLKIFPDVNAKGVVLSIPMPGHPMQAYASGGADSTLPQEEDRDFYALKALIEEHDVVFALTDSREARWLPTAMCAANNKILINAALGFDSYLVMRHGHGFSDSSDSTEESSSPATATATSRLGCYFCNDIIAATNSTRDRTLDQQCTVTRPGLSFISGALCVEIMVALLHSKHGNKHPAPRMEGGSDTVPSVNDGDSHATDSSRDADNGDDGEEDSGSKVLIPHQIRGSRTGFTQFLPQTPAFSSCTACSMPIVKAYREGGVNFVRAACEDSRVLETVSGVTQLMSEVDLDDCVDSDEDF